jgi:hypothetical protein
MTAAQGSMTLHEIVKVGTIQPTGTGPFEDNPGGVGLQRSRGLWSHPLAFLPHNLHLL